MTRLVCCRYIDPETDAASQKTGSFNAPRYYGARQARAERDRGMKRLRLGHAQEEPQSRSQKGTVRLALPLPGFIPLDESDSTVSSTVTIEEHSQKQCPATLCILPNSADSVFCRMYIYSSAPNRKPVADIAGTFGQQVQLDPLCTLCTFVS